jgi:hypothetical protein
MQATCFREDGIWRHSHAHAPAVEGLKSQAFLFNRWSSRRTVPVPDESCKKELPKSSSSLCPPAANPVSSQRRGLLATPQTRALPSEGERWKRESPRSETTCSSWPWFPNRVHEHTVPGLGQRRSVWTCGGQLWRPLAMHSCKDVKSDQTAPIPRGRKVQLLVPLDCADTERSTA